MQNIEVKKLSEYIYAQKACRVCVFSWVTLAILGSAVVLYTGNRSWRTNNIKQPHPLRFNYLIWLMYGFIIGKC